MSDLFRLHDPGPHPERPARTDAVMHAVRATEAPVEEAAPAAAEDLERVHPPEFLAGIRELCERGGGPIDLDTVVSERSYDAAVVASGAATAAVDAVLAGDLGAAFCLGRPPGHHAEAARAMGFCLVNHAAVAAGHARAAGVERVAVLDWDAHHGNGTQAIFWEDPDVLYVSLHQYPFYPGTGSRAERGGGAGEGATVNIPLAAGSSERGFMDAFEHEALPRAARLRPGAPDRLGRLRRPPRRPAVQPRPVVAGVRGDDARGARHRRRPGADPGGRLRPDRALRERLGSPHRPRLKKRGQTPMLHAVVKGCDRWPTCRYGESDEAATPAVSGGRS